MSVPTWPTFRGASDPEVEVIGGETISQQAEGGFRYVFNTSLTPRYRYTFTYAGLRTNINAPAPYADKSEAMCVRDLLVQLRGGSGYVYVVDPMTGAPVLCLLQGDSITFRKVRKTKWYEASVSFESV